MKYFLTLLFFLAFSFPTLSFAQEVDSLERILPTLRDGKEKVRILNNLGAKLQVSNSKKSLYYTSKALKIAIENNYSLEIVQAYLTQNYTYSTYGDYEKSLAISFKALNELEKAKNHQLHLEILQAIAAAYSNMGLALKGIAYKIQALDIAIKDKDSAALITLNINIGNDYRIIKDYSQARQYTHEAMRLAKTNYDTASIGFCNMNLAEINIEQKQYLKAKIYIKKAIPMLVNWDSLDYAYSIALLGEIHFHEQNFTTAIDSFNVSMGISQRFNAKADIANNAKWLAKSYEALQDYKKALFYHKTFQKQNDLVYNEEKVRQASITENGYDLHQKDLEIEAKKSELETSEDVKNLLILMIILGGVFATVIFVLVKKRSQERKNNNDRLREQNEKAEKQNMEIAKQSTLLAEINDKLEQSNQELAELNEDKNHLIGIVAHDLRSPLNQVQGLVSLLNMTADNLNEEQKQFLSMIVSSIKKQKEMINQILDLRAIESQKVNINIETINPNKILQESFEIFESAAIKKNIELKLSFEDDYTIEVDKNYFTQIVDNLISNAIKFSPQGKSVFIKTYRTKGGNKIQIEITDEGHGISKGEMNLLFQQFSKLSSRPTGGESSTGLGLSIVKKYVELMNGKVWCESEEGKGASFFVRFKEVSNEE
jgi:signal transduction histidine kinase